MPAPQYRRDVFNLSKGPGQAIANPHEDEARALEASRRADQALALQRLGQQQAQMNAQRQADLQQEAMQTEAALAAQRQSFASDMAARMRPGMSTGPQVNSFPAMGRDSLMREARNVGAANAAAANDPGRARNLRDGSRQGGGDSSNIFVSQAGSPGMPAGQVMQASFDRASGLMGDFTGLDAQVAGRSLIDREKLNAVNMGEIAMRTALMPQELQVKSVESANRTNLLAQELALKERAYEDQRSDRAYELSEAEKARQQALAQEALRVIQEDESLAGIFTHGEKTAKARGKLAAIGAVNPELAAVIARIMQNPEAIRRVRDGATNPLRSIPFFWTESNQQRSDGAEREYFRTISRLGPGLAEGEQRVSEDPAVMEALARIIGENAPATSTRGSRTDPKWWDEEKEKLYQEWSLRPSAVMDRELRRRQKGR